MKDKIDRNVYNKGIDYSEAQKDKNNKSKIRNSSTINVSVLVNASTMQGDYKHHLSTDIIKNKYDKIKALIDTKKYKALIYNAQKDTN